MIINLKIDFNPRQKYFQLLYQFEGDEYSCKVGENYLTQETYNQITSACTSPNMDSAQDVVAIAEIIADKLGK